MVRIKNINGFDELVSPLQVVKIFCQREEVTGQIMARIETTTGRYTLTYEDLDSLEERFTV